MTQVQVHKHSTGEQYNQLKISVQQLNIYTFSRWRVKQRGLAWDSSEELLSADDVTQLLFYFHKVAFKLQTVTLGIQADRKFIVFPSQICTETTFWICLIANCFKFYWDPHSLSKLFFLGSTKNERASALFKEKEGRDFFSAVIKEISY